MPKFRVILVNSDPGIMYIPVQMSVFVCCHRYPILFFSHPFILGVFGGPWGCHLWMLCHEMFPWDNSLWLSSVCWNFEAIERLLDRDRPV